MQIGEICKSRYQKELKEKDDLIYKLNYVMFFLRQETADKECFLNCDLCPAMECDLCPIFGNEIPIDEQMPLYKQNTVEFCNHYVIKALRYRQKELGY